MSKELTAAKAARMRELLAKAGQSALAEAEIGAFGIALQMADPQKHSDEVLARLWDILAEDRP